LHLDAQLRLVAVLSVLLALTLATVAIAAWEIQLARTHVLRAIDELPHKVAAELALPAEQRAPFRALVSDPAVRSAQVWSASGKLLLEAGAAPESESSADSGNDHAAGHSTSWLGDKWRQALEWSMIAPLQSTQPVVLADGGTGSLVVVVEPGAVWSSVGRHMTGIPLVLLIGCVLALITARLFQRRVTDPLARLAVATRGGQWASNEQQAGAAASVNAVNEIIDNFEAMRIRVAENERELQRVRREAEADIAKRTAESEARLQVAESAARARGDFLANMSHEVRTPLNGVVGMAELLSRTALDERQQRFLRSMRTAADATVKIINDILDVTKIEAGKMEFTPEPCVLRDLIEEVSQLYAARAQTKGLELVCRIEPSVPMIISADVLRLRQVLGNLVSNAVKYTHRGEVVLRASCDETRGGHHLHFEISDTGPGIREEDRAAIFEPYKQSGTSEQESGTGLGLPISVRLVKLMGGTGIDLHSTPGHGSRFVFWLPCQIADATQPRSSRDALKGMRILVVDDNSTSYLYLEELIESWGAEVMVLTHGKMLRDRLRGALQEQRPFQAVVLDHSLPDSPLMEMLQAVRGDAQLSATPVLLMSALDLEPIRMQGVTCAPDHCVSKPIRQQQLLETLECVRDPGRGRSAVEPGVARHMDHAGSQRIAGLAVLVVDDNAINREVAIAMLEERGCEIAIACDGSQAVAQASSRRFDLILMDCQMPVLDGYAATENIRNEERAEGCEPTQIVALTANVMPGDRERCIEAGMNEVLIKPFTGSQLDAVLGRVAERSILASRAVPAETRRDAAVGESSLNDDPLVPEFDLFETESATATAGADTAEPVLDHEQIATIRGLRRPQLLGQLCAMLREKAPQALAAIEDALAREDLAELRLTAHGFRSPVGNLGGRRLSALLGCCERAAAEGQLAEARRCAGFLRAEYERLELALGIETQDESEPRTGT
jgi:signal transduction histidine kinase/DNA-binding response OmpR family regulator/HPt (histidine-containing phosphotransfer) domain-containing protein